MLIFRTSLWPFSLADWILTDFSFVCVCVSGVGGNICSILCIHYYSTEKENSLKRLRILFSDRMQYELITRALIYSHIATRKQFRSFNGGCARLLLSKELKTLFKEINICISLNKSLYPQFNVSKQRKNALPHQSKQDQRESRKQCSSTPFFKPLLRMILTFLT